MLNWSIERILDFRVLLEKKMVCPHCGTENVEGAQVCAKCGAQQPISTAAEAATLSPPQVLSASQASEGESSQPPKTSGLAVASLVLAICGIITAGVSSLVGLVLGIVALVQIGNSKGRLTGKGLAIAGVSVSCVMFILVLSCCVFTNVFTGQDEVHKHAQAEADIVSLGNAIEMYYVDNGAYPVTLDDLYTKPTGVNLPNWNGPYLKKPPAPNDPWGRPYVYVVPGMHNTNSFDLYSLGRDGEEGGSGVDADIVNWE